MSESSTSFIFPSERDIPAWERRHAAGEVPGRWPYGLHELASYTGRLEAVAAGEPSRASVLRSRARALLPGRPGPKRPAGDGAQGVGARGIGPRSIGLTWDENAARRMYLEHRHDEMYSGVIWVTDILARGGDIGTMRSVLRGMNGLWVISRGQQAAVERLVGDDGPPVGFFRFGVDETFFTPAPPAERPLVLSVGGDRDRDTATLFEALDEVKRRASDAEVVVQTSSDLPAPDGVTKLARVSHSELRALYRRASVVAIATRPNLHASGMTVSLEAMATARPVVMTDTPGIDDYVAHEQTGFLTPVGDPRAMAGRVLRLLADPTLAEQFGLAGRAAVEAGLTSSHMVRELAAFTGLQRPTPSPATGDAAHATLP
ncbi:glycosyltransferase family 4 protein [Subtercola sp. Z020]|uniref:glycosyltransferase family 4 protein n=1 Tax=Subtercola sp. Z020 TaxID=2080582 RepID=UPI001E3D36EB|nr:glycosyltransferase family 4 protein [Subtercola sp. Z020]